MSIKIGKRAKVEEQLLENNFCDKTKTHITPQNEKKIKRKAFLTISIVIALIGCTLLSTVPACNSGIIMLGDSETDTEPEAIADDKNQTKY